MNLMLGTADYRGKYSVPAHTMREWYLLGTFDSRPRSTTRRPNAASPSGWTAWTFNGSTSRLGTTAWKFMFAADSLHL